MKIIFKINQAFNTNYHNKVQFKNYQIIAIFSFNQNRSKTYPFNKMTMNGSCKIIHKINQ